MLHTSFSLIACCTNTHSYQNCCFQYRLNFSKLLFRLRRCALNLSQWFSTWAESPPGGDFEESTIDQNKRGDRGDKTTQRGRKRSTSVTDRSLPQLTTIELTSVVTIIFSKQRNRFLAHKRGDLRLYLTEMSPNISKVCENRQAHPSHWIGDHRMYQFLQIKFTENTTSCLLYQA